MRSRTRKSIGRWIRRLLTLRILFCLGLLAATSTLVAWTSHRHIAYHTDVTRTRQLYLGFEDAAIWIGWTAFIGSDDEFDDFTRRHEVGRESWAHPEVRWDVSDYGLSGVQTQAPAFPTHYHIRMPASAFGPPHDDDSMNCRITTAAISSNWLIVPIWYIQIPAAIVVLMFVWRWVREDLRRSREPDVARCPACDYIVEGNASGVCPECGRATRADVAAAIQCGSLISAGVETRVERRLPLGSDQPGA
ncbi:MAG TPA: hypothetical protein P5081_14170 [Phycisphaerae bacterium]|nr:hypothetical protein [Phycisphaerae bacterium]HRW54017.1 hypothetical protein [Phycisphaerae bacterium]